MNEDFHVPTQRAAPGEIAPLRGPLCCSLSLAILVDPFANEVGDHACRDGQKESNEVFHVLHPLPAVGMGWDSEPIIPAFGKIRKAERRGSPA